MSATRIVVIASFFLAVGTINAAATSGFGCYRVNVGPDDPLAVRSQPSATSERIARVHRDNQPIIALARGLPRGESVQPTLFDVYRAEREVCQPQGRPVGARWCPVSLFDGSGMRSGWLKRRFVDTAECP